MRRYLFTLLMILGLPNIMAQTTIVCNTEGDLPGLLAEKAQGVTKLAISGAVSAEDIRAINNYPKNISPKDRGITFLECISTK